MGFPIALAFAIGIVAGLRSLTAPAVVCVAAQLGWIDLRQSPLAFMGSNIACWIFGLLAIGELVMDKLPFTPSRLTPGPLGGRILLGGLAGATLVSAASPSIIAGAIAGAVGGLVGAYAGYQVRVGAVRALGPPDLAVALIEDVIAVGGGLLIASRLQ
jgi:uncharacterized membrane protein